MGSGGICRQWRGNNRAMDEFEHEYMYTYIYTFFWHTFLILFVPVQSQIQAYLRSIGNKGAHDIIVRTETSRF